jgi:transposase-like protein
MKNTNHLLEWLTDPRTLEYFGPTFKLRADVLACVIKSGNLSEVARRHDVSRAAASKQARRVKSIFPVVNLQLT